MSRPTLEEQLAGLSSDVRRTFERFDAFARSRPAVRVSDLFEGRSYKIHNRVVARRDPKANSGDSYLGIQFALPPRDLHRRTSAEVARWVESRPARPSGGNPWIFARGEGPALHAWLTATFELAYRAVSSDRILSTPLEARPSEADTKKRGRSQAAPNLLS